MQSYVRGSLAFVTSNEGDQLSQFTQDCPSFTPDTESFVPERSVLGNPGPIYNHSSPLFSSRILQPHSGNPSNADQVVNLRGTVDEIQRYVELH